MTDPRFGVNIACFKGDFPFAKACCSSVRKYLGEIPICLFVDGEFSVKELQDTYGVRVVYARDVADDELRKRSYGYGVTKMVVLWASPFERFLYLDADTVVWGNVLEGLDLDAADFIFNEPHEPYTEFILKSQYFDYDRLFDHVKPFNWQGLPFFNTGVFVASRGQFSTSEYYELLDVKMRHPSLLPTGEQGILNVMVFRAAEERRLTIAQARLQTVVPVVPRAELERRFHIRDGVPQVSPDDRTIVHWAGPKPFSLHPEVFSEPMNHFRRQSFRERRDPLSALGRTALVIEELQADRRAAIPPGLRRSVRDFKRWVRSPLRARESGLA